MRGIVYMNDTTIIVLGASGDLAKRKLLPSIYRLIKYKKLSNFLIVGAAIDNITQQEICERAKEFVTNRDEDIWQQLCSRFEYYQVDLTSKDAMAQFAKNVAKREKKYKLLGNRVVYLALASHLFCDVTEQLATSGLVQKYTPQQKVWHRIVYEKPFGHNLPSAHLINECIAKLLDEKQVFRIDHYLTKELVGNIALVRFTNCVFEPLWNNRYIDHVEVILSETNDILGRGRYYDNYGAVRDVVQNHMLELVALIGMEAPEKLTGEYIRSQRVKVLQDFEFIDGVYGQYEGYLKEQDVANNSKTETFATLYGHIKNPRWAGVPFYFKTGKALNKQETVIHLKFKQVDCLLAKECPSETNSLTIRVFPDATFSLRLNAKQPGRANDVVPVKMEFCHSCLFGKETPQAHEVLLEEVMRGESSVSVRFDEIERSWEIIDQLKKMDLPVGTYKKGSEGPQEMFDFMKKHGMRWRS